jgi:SAM-dependent MidA family methyltransferase
MVVVGARRLAAWLFPVAARLLSGVAGARGGARDVRKVEVDADVLADPVKRLAALKVDSSGTLSVPVPRVAEPAEGTRPAAGPVVKSAWTPALDELTMRIAVRGPVTVAEFMTVALSHPQHGYYIRGRQPTAELHGQQDGVFGAGGDFTTSPEISQCFGELVGVWAVAQWMALGQPRRVRLLELGPGRGTLMSDLLRSLGSFPAFADAVERGGGVRMVETSPALRSVQQRTLGCEPLVQPTSSGSSPQSPEAQPSQPQPPLHADDEWESSRRAGLLRMRAPVGRAAAGSDPSKTKLVHIEWFREVKDALGLGGNADRQDEEAHGSASGGGSSGLTDSAGNPLSARATLTDASGSPLRSPAAVAAGEGRESAPVIVVAQELFDALPIHQFEYSSSGEWVERLVDIDPEPEAAPELVEQAVAAGQPVDRRHHLRFVLSRGQTPASRVLLNRTVLQQDPASLARAQAVPGDAVEVCAVGAGLVQEIGSELQRCGGAMLIIDYGDNSPGASSLRGIQAHKFVHPLLEPGNVDLSADVDFGLLRRVALQLRQQGLRLRVGGRIEPLGGPGGARVDVMGPVTQGEFLKAMGIETRVAVLLRACEGDEQRQQQIFRAFKRLTERETYDEQGNAVAGMGVSYKAMAVVAPMPGKEALAELQQAGFPASTHTEPDRTGLAQRRGEVGRTLAVPSGLGLR